MRVKLSMTKTVSWALSFSTMMSAALIVGCNSSPGLDDPEVKKTLQAQTEAIQKSDAEASALLKKASRGKQAPMIKNIKGRLGTGSAEQ
jgi:hypothetical protein